jgi:transcriptional antiterminator RfaH
MGGKTAAMREQQAQIEAPKGPRWFVVVCHSGREREAKARLIEQGFQVYLPMRLNHPRAKRPITPFFPRYLFVRFNPSIDQWLCICSTIGVLDIIRSGAGYPQAVSDHWIKQIQAWEIEGVIHLLAPVKKAGPAFKKGDRVRVIDGHFAGFEGLVHIANDTDRITVMLALVAKGESVKVKLQARSLEDRRPPAGVLETR